LEYYIPRLFEAAALCAALYFVGFCYRSASLPKTILKTISIAVLAVISVLSGAPIWLSLALLACAIGDYYLSLEDGPAFLKGVGAFAIGHLFYIVLFITDPLSDLSRITNTAQIATLSILGFISLIMLIWLWYRAGDFRYAVAGYIVIITTMGIMTASLPWQENYNTVILGVMFFILSDLVLSAELFILSKNGSMRKFTPFIVWGFYWFAQVLITAGFVFRVVET
jgi:uncharacterized membrane protein YhhN